MDGSGWTGREGAGGRERVDGSAATVRGFFTEGEWARVVRRVNETFARFTGDDDRSDNL